MAYLYWRLVTSVTTLLYVLMLICLPFSSAYSAVFLFALIGFWSRLPGVAIPSPLYFLYLLDFIDIFSLIIAINIGGIQAAVFTLFLNLISRACGNFPYWAGVVKDSVAQAIACLFIPFIHHATGADIVVSMTIYTILRCLLFIPMRIVPDGTSFFYFIFYDLIGVTIAMVAINVFYARLCGSYLDSLLQQGVQFNWILFLVVTVIIIILKKRSSKKSEDKKTIISDIFEIFSLLIKRILRIKDKPVEKETEYDEMMEVKKAIKEAQQSDKNKIKN